MYNDRKSNRQDRKLDSLQRKVHGLQSKKASVDTMIYALASELHCLADLIGREYEIVYDGFGKPIKVLQKPIPFNKFMALLGQMRLKNEVMDRQMKKRKHA